MHRLTHLHGPRLMLCTLVLGVLALAVPASRAAAQENARFYPQTGYTIADGAFWDYFRQRGGLRTFGYPVSNPFVLSGFRVQIFQREILQQQPDGSVTMMNILDEGLMPYTRINGSTFPAADPEVLARQPQVGAPDYHVKALQFVKDYAPDMWQGLKVNFYQTFANSVRAQEAFPDGRVNPGLLLGFNLEIWGLPTSKPAFDPANAGFVYLRFQRGIMHFDTSTGTTQGLLLADYVKSILTLRTLPPDLDSQARGSPLYGQFDPRMVSSVKQPRDLPASDLSDAFRREPTVMVDAGHGGRETGATYKFPDGSMLMEKDLNLKVATRLAELLREGGINAMQSRTADSQLNGSRDLTADGKVNLSDELQARVDRANEMRADLLVSVHFNGVTDASRRGTQVFYADGRPFVDRNRALAELTQSHLVKALKEAGYETIDRKATVDTIVLGHGAHYFLLGPASEHVKRPTEMPGIIGEPLFVTNPDDANALRQDRIQAAIARGYAEAVKAYFKQFPVT